MNEINCNNCAICDFKESLCHRCDEMKRLGSAEDIEKALIRVFSETGDDCISRQMAIDAVECITSSMSVCINKDECHGMKRMQQQAANELANLPSAQSEHKTGRWIETEDGWDGTYFVCSNCGCPWTLIDGDPRDNGMNYCPNCGADMRGEE